jgi:hypothetical protein
MGRERRLGCGSREVAVKKEKSHPPFYGRMERLGEVGFSGSSLLQF